MPGNKPKHSPKPWKKSFRGKSVMAGGILIRQQSQPIAASVRVQQQLAETLEANAMLIAAAPDLLAACKEILRCDFYGDFSQPLAEEEADEEKTGSHPRVHAALDAVRLAVAAAEGN